MIWNSFRQTGIILFSDAMGIPYGLTEKVYFLLYNWNINVCKEIPGNVKKYSCYQQKYFVNLDVLEVSNSSDMFLIIMDMDTLVVYF